MASTPRVHDIEKTVFGNKVKTDFIDAPYTTIKNEQGGARTIPDLENNLKVSMGVERVMFNSIRKLDKEFGPSGETVFELGTKDARVRFVGDWSLVSGNSGSRPQTTDTASFYEITFYGTGINLLHLLDASVRTYDIYLDGAFSSTKTINGSSVLLNRNYNSNSVVGLFSGLSLGYHTIRVEANTLPQFSLFGVEILNENASAQLTVNAGEPFVGGNSATLSAQQLLDSKPSELTGTKGGRVVTYLDQEGNLGQAVTAVDPAVTTGDPTELVTNGDFATGDLTGWTTALGSPAGSVTVNGSNQAIMTLAGSFGTQAALYQTLTTVIGQKYTVNFDLINVSGPGGGVGVAQVFTDGTRTVDIASATYQIGDSGSKSITFTATTTTSTIQFQPSVQFGTSMTVDNASIKETAYDFLALGNTDHSQEEVVKTIPYKEFGANRADDFSTLTTSSDRAFTLDDGTTTLVGNDVISESGGVTTPMDEGVYLVTNSTSSLTITFVGSGLDVKWAGAANGTNAAANAYEVFVNGGSVGNWDTVEASAGSPKRKTLCSGLPYGTHTVTIKRNTASVWGLGIKDYIVYGPKKPELPDNTFELADYNVMADYSTTVGGEVGEVANGVLRKSSFRELVYTGTWIAPTIDTITFNSGFNLRSNTVGGTITYVFYGTGVIWNTAFNSAETYDQDITIDGSSDLSSFTTSFKSSTTGLTLTPSTGKISGTASGSNHGLIEISGLPLGFHTISILQNTGNFYSDGFDIITPIHINNTKIGSLSLEDKREGQQKETDAKSIDMGRAKAWLYFDQINQAILESYNISAVLDDGGTYGEQHIYFKRPFSSTNYIAVFGGETDDISYRTTVTGSSAVNGEKNKHYYTTQMYDHDGTPRNGLLCVVFFGQLENEEDLDLGDL